MTDLRDPNKPEPLSGNETLGPGGTKVQDFWSWAFSDLRNNVTRGILAEFLVAKAVGSELTVRQTWDDFDVLTPYGTRIEVKSSGYLQSWSQQDLSRISFAGLKARSWNAQTGERSADRIFKADVYVFAVETSRDPVQYDMTNLDTWRFYVVPVTTLRELDYGSISLATLERLGFEAVSFDDLAAAVQRTSRP